MFLNVTAIPFPPRLMPAPRRLGLRHPPRVPCPSSPSAPAVGPALWLGPSAATAFALGQRLDVRSHAAAQRGQVVAALEHADHWQAQPNNLSREPAKVVLAQPQRTERVVAVRVEARGDKQRVGAEVHDGGQQRLAPRLAEFCRARARRQRRVDGASIAARGGAGAGEERALVRRHVQQRGVVRHQRGVPVAVVHVKIEDGDAPHAVTRSRSRHAN